MTIARNARSPARDLLLLVTPESEALYSDVVQRLQRRCNARSIVQGRGARSALAEAASNTPSHVVVVPVSFGASGPWPAELAGLLRWARTQWPAVGFVQSQPIASREHIVGWASQQVQASCQRWSQAASSDRTGVLVVGEGGTPGANAEVYALAGLLREYQNCSITEVALLRETRSTIDMGIERCRRLGARHMIVLPLSLLDGAFRQEVRAQTEAASGGRMTEAVTIAAPLLTPAMASAVVYRRYVDAVDRWRLYKDDGCISSGEHQHHSFDVVESADKDMLPPRYHGNRVVSAASMRSAPLVYDAEGRVAWDRVWKGFCDLALAGGPPHRGSLLEPPSREDVMASPSDSARAAAEIARGLSLVTALPVVTDCAPGWVGLVCEDEEMAVWLLRAIVVENISVRRERATLFLPAGPAFRIEKEIKNVITAVAKTHHYWTEHRAAR